MHYRGHKAGIEQNEEIDKIIESLKTKNRYQLRNDQKVQKDELRVKEYKQIIAAKLKDPFANISSIKSKVKLQRATDQRSRTTSKN